MFGADIRRHRERPATGIGPATPMRNTMVPGDAIEGLDRVKYSNCDIFRVNWRDSIH
jgi:hypothetical protein